MSERKTAEIKFRCTPSFKASVQASAQAAELSMSEYIEAAVQEKEWAPQNAALDGTRLIGNAIAEMRIDEAPYGAEEGDIVRNRETGEAFLVVPVGVTVEDANGNVLFEGSAEEFDVALAEPGAIVACDCACRPWEFCTHKARA